MNDVNIGQNFSKMFHISLGANYFWPLLYMLTVGF